MRFSRGNLQYQASSHTWRFAPDQYGCCGGDNGKMVVLGLTWQMDFGRQFRKGEKTLQNGGYDNGMVR